MTVDRKGVLNCVYVGMYIVVYIPICTDAG